MNRAPFLCLVFFGIFGVSWGHEELYTIPVCEYKGPEDVYVDYSNTGLTKLSKSSVLDSSIKCLNFDGNDINEIDQETFDNVPDMYYLNLAKNPVHFKNFISTNIPNLETLILDGPFENSYRGHYNAIYWNTNSEWTLFLPELKKLSLRYYRDYSDLIPLWLVVLEVPILTHLYLSGNELTTIANLASLPNLTHLNVDDNNMKYISGSFFKNLEYLSMERNNIQNVCGTFCKSHSMTPHGMHNLKYLSLAGNMIESIGSDAFADLENLLVLNLAENKINDFPQHIFDTMPKLQNLTLDKNNLTRVPDIHALWELEVLSLNDNNIMFIDETTFGNMTKLAKVYLRKNGMTTIADMAFANLPNLVMLDLSWNRINYLPEDWISLNNRLQILHLDGNKFTDIGNMSLKQLNYMQTLSAALNPIEAISIGSLMELPRNISIKLVPLDWQATPVPLQ